MSQSRDSRPALILIALAASGCYVPISNAVPHGASTVGAGDYRITGTLEYPVLDQLATAASPPDASAPSEFPVSKAPYGSVQISYGLADDFNAEAGLDGELQGILPVPHGVFLGFRYVAYRSSNVRIGLGARFGYLGFGASYPTEPFEGATISGYHGAASAGATLVRWRRVQPTLGVSVQPYRVVPTFQEVELEPMQGLNVAATLGLRLPYVTPFVTGGYLSTNNVRGQTPYFTFGLARTM